MTSVALQQFHAEKYESTNNGQLEQHGDKVFGLYATRTNQKLSRCNMHRLAIATGPNK